MSGLLSDGRMYVGISEIYNTLLSASSVTILGWPNLALRIVLNIYVSQLTDTDILRSSRESKSEFKTSKSP